MLPHAQLAVLPGTSHNPGVLERSDRVFSRVSAFLDEPLGKGR